MPEDSRELAELRESVERLSQKISELEQRLRIVEGQPSQVQESVAPRREEPAIPLPIPHTRSSQAKPEHRAAKLESRFGLTLVNRIGVITLIIGILFFFKYAVENQWITESGRVLLGLAGGLLTLWIGDRLWKRGQGSFAQGISGLGIAGLFISLYASSAYYELVAHTTAFAGMALVTIIACAASFRYASPAMAGLGLMGGYLTPLLLSTGEDRPSTLFGYILLLNLGAVFIAARRRWPSVEVLAFIATVFLFGNWFEKQFQGEIFWVAVLFLVAFYALFFTRNIQLAAAAQILVILGFAGVCGLTSLTAHPPRAAHFFWLLLAATVASAAVAAARRWAFQSVATFVLFWGFWFWASTAMTIPRVSTTATASFAFVLFLIWSVWPKDRNHPFLLTSIPANAVFYFFSVWHVYKNESSLYLSVFALGLAGLYIALNFRFRKEETSQATSSLCLLVALGFITIALPLAFSTYAITMTWSLEFMAVSWLAWRQNSWQVCWAAGALFGLVMIRLLVFDLWLSTTRMIVNARLFTFLIAAACFWICAKWMGRTKNAVIVYCTGHALLLIAGASEIVEWAHQSVAPANLSSVINMSTSLLVAGYALVLIALGVIRRFALNRILGLALIGLVVLKLYFYDVWLLTRIYRISAFVVLGVLLLATSYLYSRFRHKIGSLFSD